MTTSLRRRTEFHTLTVAHVERLTDDAVAVTFDVPEDVVDQFEFRAGQSLTLRRIIDGRDERRSYSICAVVGAKPRIGVREVPGGVFSPWLVHEVRPGDQIEVLPPSGDFTPDLTPARHVLLAAGSGITPVMSIVSSVLRDPAASAMVLYGNRRTNTVMFADELADLKDRFTARMELVHVLSREPREAELFTGRLDGEKLRKLLPLLTTVSEVDQWWLCGPFGMVTEARQVLINELGVPRERVHFELFYVEDTPPEQVHHEDPTTAGPSAEVTVRLDGRTTTAVVPRETTLLEGAQRVRPDLPFACKGGVCGTCRAKVVSGKVHMRRNFALEDAEVEAGFVVTCQTVATSDEVEVDFDQ